MRALVICTLGVLALFSAGCSTINADAAKAHYQAEEKRIEKMSEDRPIVEITAHEGQPITINAAAFKVRAPANGGAAQQPIRQYAEQEHPAWRVVDRAIGAIDGGVRAAIPFIGGIGMVRATGNVATDVAASVGAVSTTGMQQVGAMGQAGLDTAAKISEQGIAAASKDPVIVDTKVVNPVIVNPITVDPVVVNPVIVNPVVTP